MMKKLMMFLVLAVSLLVVGNLEAGVFNAVNVGDIVEVINASEPSIAFGYDFVSEESVQTATVSLVTYSNRDFALGSLRFGYSGEELDKPNSIIGGVELITPNIVRRFVPESLKDWQANLKVLSLIPSVSVMGGYAIDRDELDENEKWVGLVTFGPKIRF